MENDVILECTKCGKKWEFTHKSYVLSLINSGKIEIKPSIKIKKFHEIYDKFSLLHAEDDCNGDIEINRNVKFNIEFVTEEKE